MQANTILVLAKKNEMKPRKVTTYMPMSLKLNATLRFLL